MVTYFRYGILLLSVSLYLCSSDGNCNSKNHFGPNCAFLCHCLNNEQCDINTGNCSFGCDFNWVGPGCQRRNIVPIGRDEKEMVTRHQSNIDEGYFAVLAVDRNLSTCSYTNYANKTQDIPWWRLWFKNIHKIKTISILTAKDYLDYFENFKVTVENSTFNDRYSNEVFGRKKCYIHDKTAPRTVDITVTCDTAIYGNQIKIRLATRSTQLVLCDVRIYGECVDGTFGVSCTERCSTHCKDTCDKDYGTCNFCKSGWTGNSCNRSCPDGKYGENCVHDCSGFCINNTACRKTDGVCVDGCSPGYRERKCDQTCKFGYYGMACKEKCSTFCLKKGSGYCSHVNGRCLHGCQAGRQGTHCNRTCVNGKYGRNCILTCSGNCLNNSICSKVNGSCEHGCKAGYKGNTCNEVCPNGTYGAECVSICSMHCLNGSVCMYTNGSCRNGCDPGWTGDNCLDECANGTYGANCTFNCSGNCLNGSVCLHTNGSCVHGCAPGWIGETCKKKYITEAEKHVRVNDDEENVASSIITITAVIVLLVVVVVVSYWKRKALIEKFNSFQYWHRRQQNHDDVIFHNEYINEEVATEEISRNHADQAMSAQSTDPVYNKISLVDIQLNEFKASKDVEYNNDIPTKRTPNAISISELETAMMKKCLIKGYFPSQFETIATGLLYPTTAAVKPRNIHKNRFKKIYPYDHCRVKLKVLPEEPDSDYINASFIKGQGKANVYIASQGPVNENINDFWRMIWEMDVRTVVMVTNLAENGKMKCVQYWGTKDVVVQYGKIHVTTQAENVYAEFTIRELVLFHQGDVLTKRNVTQYHFTAWPDTGVPETSSSLLQFWRKVRQNDEKKDHIWLVHCSAGVGRTGTFLATDILFDQGEKMGFVDVYQCVKDLREQRVNLVQTHEQYIYLHKLMLEVFSLPSKPVSLDEFMLSYHQLQEKDKSGKMNLWREYTSIESGVTWPTAVNDQQEGGKKETTVDIPADAFRPILSNYVPGSSNAIKATYVPSYFYLHEYIIAQWRPQFKMETCRLVFEKQIETVVTFPADQRDDEIFFEESVSESDPLAVVCQSQIQKGDFIVKGQFLQSINGKHYFKEIIFKCWSSESLVPEDPQAILDLVTEVDTQRHHSSAHRRKSILFQCWDGVDRSGLLAVIINVLDRARVDNEVSIPQVIRQLRHNKKELITSCEQYKFCYDVLHCRLASKMTYANV